jgi:hypothetical protein
MVAPVCVALIVPLVLPAAEQTASDNDVGTTVIVPAAEPGSAVAERISTARISAAAIVFFIAERLRRMQTTYRMCAFVMPSMMEFPP